jgi:hypothetical protein
MTRRVLSRVNAVVSPDVPRRYGRVKHRLVGRRPVLLRELVREHAHPVLPSSAGTERRRWVSYPSGLRSVFGGEPRLVIGASEEAGARREVGPYLRQ